MSETNLQLFPGVFRSTVGGENPGFFLHSDGRVGIGNKAPTARPSWSSNNADRNKLNVTGHTHIDGNLNVTGHLYGDGSTLSGVAAVVGGYWNLDQLNNDISYSVGNVKIGTGTPNANLDVVGSARVSNVMTIGTTKTFVVTVSDASGANKYYIDGVKQPYLTLHQHQTYIFDLSSPTLSAGGGVGHPFVFQTTNENDGTTNGTPYTTGITPTGAYGSTQKRTFVVPAGAPTTLYYYCTQHPGMGAAVSISSEAELVVSGRIGARDLVVTGTGGTSVGGGTTAQREEYPNLGTIRYNTTTGFMEAYSVAGWTSIAQPPTVASISPLTTLISGGRAPGWTGGTKIVASDREANDGLGHSIAMSGDGTKVIVGAPYEDHDKVGGNYINGAGSAYIYTYDGTNWDAGEKIVAPDRAVGGDYFGWSVGINSDGTKVIVGVYRNDPGQPVVNNAGSAYIYAYDGTNWDSGYKLVAPDKEADDRFGYSVAMSGGTSGDQLRVIVGASHEDHDKVGGNYISTAGAAYIYTYDGTNWDTGEKIVASDRASQNYFGFRVAISLDGTKVIVGAYRNDPGQPVVGDAGSAYIYAYDGTNWDAGEKIVAPDKQGSDEFGYSVAMNGDGTKVIVGARYEAHDKVGGDQKTRAGSAYIYTYDGTNWDTGEKIVASNRDVNDYFGWSVGMNSDGTKVIVGAIGEDLSATSFNHGSAYIYAYDGTNWDAGTKIVAPDREVNDNFGWSVAMSGGTSGDGTKVIVGSPYEDHDKAGGNTLNSAGSAYIFDYQTTYVFDTSTQVFTATGTGIVNGSAVQLEGADGSLYNVADAVMNNAGTQVTFKMGSKGDEFPPSAMSTNTSITGYVASASHDNSAAWKAFDDGSNYWDVNNDSYSSSAPYLAVLDSAATQDISGTTHRGHWIQLQTPSPVILNRAVIGTTTSDYQHGQFVILGSNDNTNWTPLHAGLGTTISTNVTTLSAGSTEAFSYFRVVIKSKGAGSSNNNLAINNIQFFGGSGSWDIAQQPYKIRVTSTSGLNGSSSAVIGFETGWTTAAGANLNFDSETSSSRTLVGTDGGGGTNRRFSVAPGSNALPPNLTLTGSTGVISGQISALGTTSVTFRLTDNASELFTDRAINIVGVSDLYPFSPNPFTFTNAGEVGRLGPTFADMKSAYGASGWWQNTENFNEISGKQGFQLWTVPQTTTYRITANGARGGTTNVSFGDLNYPGAGAQIRADFALTKGTKLVIIVGQTARTAEQFDGEAAGGGGGATWVLKENFTTSTNDIYMVAGGGAGQASDDLTNHTAASGGTSQASISDTGGGETSQGDTLRNAGGGAGWGSNGIGGGFTGSADNGGDTFGSKPASGATGGNYTYGTPNWDGQGGFGGGGSSSIQIPGGGGGLSGGNAAYNRYASGATGWGHAQGGTSYIMPNATGGVTVTNRVFVGTNSYIDGSVVIELL